MAAATDFSLWASDHWRSHETDAEHQARVEKTETYVNDLLGQVERAARTRLEASLTVIFGLGGPQYRRLRDRAREAYDRDVAAARALYDETCDYVMRTGDDLLPELDQQWTALIDPDRAARLWPAEQLQAAE